MELIDDLIGQGEPSPDAMSNPGVAAQHDTLLKTELPPVVMSRNDPGATADMTRTAERAMPPHHHHDWAHASLESGGLASRPGATPGHRGRTRV
jgi:hypothetical protein